MPVPVRRTQEQRSRNTRNKLLDATLSCLVERGYAATATTEVCRRAGVSRGALLHHFPTREQLVICAITHLADRRAHEIRAHARSLARGQSDLDSVLEMMWSAFAGPLFQAALELWVAARSDKQLHRALYPMERAMGSAMRAFWGELFKGAPRPGSDDSQRLNDLVALSQHLLRGMALQRILKPSDADRQRLFALWKQMARRELEATVTATPRRRAARR